MIKVTIRVIEQCAGPLEALSTSDVARKEMSVKTSFQISKFREEFVKHLELFESERQRLVDINGDRDDKGELIRVPVGTEGRFLYTFNQDHEKAKAFADGMEELRSIEVGLKSKLKLRLSEIPKGILCADDFVSLGAIVDFKE